MLSSAPAGAVALGGSYEKHASTGVWSWKHAHTYPCTHSPRPRATLGMGASQQKPKVCMCVYVCMRVHGQHTRDEHETRWPWLTPSRTPHTFKTHLPCVSAFLPRKTKNQK